MKYINLKWFIQLHESKISKNQTIPTNLLGNSTIYCFTPFSCTLPAAHKPPKFIALSSYRPTQNSFLAEEPRSKNAANPSFPSFNGPRGALCPLRKGSSKYYFTLPGCDSSIRAYNIDITVSKDPQAGS